MEVLSRRMPWIDLFFFLNIDSGYSEEKDLEGKRKSNRTSLEAINIAQVSVMVAWTKLMVVESERS